MVKPLGLTVMGRCRGVKYDPRRLGLAVEVLLPGALSSMEDRSHSQLPVEHADSMPASVSPHPLAKE